MRNRIKELRQVRAGDLLPDPRNFRRHPERQRKAMAQMVERLGYVNAVVARETPEGLVLIDGHLRAGLDPGQTVPVLVVDLDERESGEALATLDPLAAMAESDRAAFDSLLAEVVRDGDDAVAKILDTGPLADTREPVSRPDKPVRPADKLMCPKCGLEFEDEGR